MSYTEIRKRLTAVTKSYHKSGEWEAYSDFCEHRILCKDDKDDPDCFRVVAVTYCREDLEFLANAKKDIKELLEDVRHKVHYIHELEVKNERYKRERDEEMRASAKAYSERDHLLKVNELLRKGLLGTEE